MNVFHFTRTKTHFFRLFHMCLKKLEIQISVEPPSRQQESNGLKYSAKSSLSFFFVFCFFIICVLGST